MDHGPPPDGMNRGPPPGGDHDRGPELLTVIWTFTTLALAVVSLKLYTRFRILREPGFDDAFTAVSVVLVTICASLMTAGVHAGLGRHTYYLDSHQRSQAMKLNLIANPFGVLAYSLPNLSVAMFLNRILSLDTGRKWFIYSVAISQNVFALASSILLFVQCIPLSFLWNHSTKATCLPIDGILAYSYFVGAYSAFTDIFLAVVPIVAFWRLQLKLTTKIGVCLLMSTTFWSVLSLHRPVSSELILYSAAICAIVKTTKLENLKNLADFSYGGVDMLLWAVVESNVIIIAACVPSLRPFIVATKKNSINGYDPYAKRKALRLKESPYNLETIGSKRTKHISLGTCSETSLPPKDVIESYSEV